LQRERREGRKRQVALRRASASGKRKRKVGGKLAGGPVAGVPVFGRSLQQSKEREGKSPGKKREGEKEMDLRILGSTRGAGLFQLRSVNSGRGERGGEGRKEDTKLVPRSTGSPFLMHNCRWGGKGLKRKKRAREGNDDAHILSQTSAHLKGGGGEREKKGGKSASDRFFFCFDRGPKERGKGKF